MLVVKKIGFQCIYTLKKNPKKKKYSFFQQSFCVISSCLHLFIYFFCSVFGVQIFLLFQLFLRVLFNYSASQRHIERVVVVVVDSFFISSHFQKQQQQHDQQQLANAIQNLMHPQARKNNRRAVVLPCAAFNY